MGVGAVLIEKRNGDRTAVGLRLYFPEGEEPVVLAEALENAGWTERRAGLTLPRQEAVNGTASMTFSKLGTAGQGYWTEAEEARNLRELGDILASHGVEQVLDEAAGFEPYEAALHGPRH